MKALTDRSGKRIKAGDKVVVEFEDEASVCLVEALGRSNLTVKHKGKIKKVPASSVRLYRRKQETGGQDHDFQPGQWVRINCKGKIYDGWVGTVKFLVNRNTVSVLVPPQSSKRENWQEPVCPVEWLEPAKRPDYN